MKKFVKYILTAAISLSFISAAFADQAYFGAPKKGNANDMRAGYVVLINDTNGTLPVQAVFRESGTAWPLMYIGPAGSPTSMITFDINSRDVGVDISVNGGPYKRANGVLIPPYNPLHITYSASANRMPVIKG